MIEENEFNEWLQHPVTRAVRGLLNARRETRRQSWEGGSYTDYSKDATILVNVGNLGECKGLAFAAELDYQDYVTEIETDGQQLGPEAPRSSGVA